MRNKFAKISIIGVGLIGGSLGMSLKKERLVAEIVGIGRDEEKLKQAKKLGALDRWTLDFKKGVQNADLVILATPVRTIPQIIRRLTPYFKEKCIISDVGSVKFSVIQAIESFLPKNIYFVGGHPIAGSEQAGIQFAQEDLFKNRVCVLTPTQNTNQEALAQIKSMWEEVGASLVMLSPEEHDTIMGAVSHLPHLVAVSLVNTVGASPKSGKKFLSSVGSGFKDTTRIAASSPILWRDIFLENKEVILKMIDKFKITLENLREFIACEEDNKLFRELKKAKDLRNKI